MNPRSRFQVPGKRASRAFQVPGSKFQVKSSVSYLRSVVCCLLSAVPASPPVFRRQQARRSGRQLSASPGQPPPVLLSWKLSSLSRFWG